MAKTNRSDMTTPEERFGELRSLLNGAPDAAAFIEIIEAAEAAFATHPDQVTAQWVPYMEGSLRRWPAHHCILPLSSVRDAAAAATRPWASLCRGLDFGAYGLTAGEVEELTKGGFFATFEGIEHLSIAKGQIRKRGVALLGDAGALAHLVSLDISENRLHKATFASLVGFLTDAPLRTLRASRCTLKADHAFALASSEGLRELEELDLSHNALGYHGARELARGWRDALRRVNLSHCQLDGTSIEALAPRLAGLDALRLDGNYIMPAGVHALDAVGALPSLRDRDTLSMSGQKIGDGGLAAFIASGTLAGLDTLDLHNCDIGPAGCAELARCDDLAGLTSLTLGHNAELRGDGLASLLSSRTLSSLEHLSVHSSNLEDLPELADGLPALTSLDLSWNRLSAADGRRIEAWPGFPRLTSITLTDGIAQGAGRILHGSDHAHAALHVRWK